LDGRSHLRVSFAPADFWSPHRAGAGARWASGAGEAAAAARCAANFVAQVDGAGALSTVGGVGVSAVATWLLSTASGAATSGATADEDSAGAAEGAAAGAGAGAGAAAGAAAGAGAGAGAAGFASLAAHDATGAAGAAGLLASKAFSAASRVALSYSGSLQAGAKLGVKAGALNLNWPGTNEDEETLRDIGAQRIC